MKRFLEWIGVKEQLHDMEHKPPFVSVRNQIRTIDYRRLHSKLGQISPDDFDLVQKGFRKLYW